MFRPFLYIVLLLAAVGCVDPEVADVPVETAVVEKKFVGSDTCGECHSDAYEAWLGSHHQRAMEVPSGDSIEADFSDTRFDYFGQSSRFFKDDDDYFVETTNNEGSLETYKVAYTFGVEPLQQYLLEYANGRKQALTIAWNNHRLEDGGQTWYHLHPDELVDHEDVLHWTQPSATWNYMCADCHSTGLVKNYDAATDTYDTSYAEISVGCEACHGPGSAHVDSARRGESPASLASMDGQVTLCAHCHSRRSQLAEGFVGGKSFFDHYLPMILEDDLYHADGQIFDEVYVYGSFVQSKMHAAGVECSDCHEPHTLSLKAQGDAVCTQCHNEAGRPDFPTLPLAKFDSPEHHHHTADVTCVSCHMPDKVYMGIDARRDHSFRIPRPDLSASLGVPNACNQCHTDETVDWAAQNTQAWYGDQPPHFATAFAAGRQMLPEAEILLADIADDKSRPAIVRATALSLLGNYHAYPSGRVVQRNLKDPDPLVRIGALRGSGRWPGTERWPMVRSLLDDEVLAVRVQAVRVMLPAAPSLDPAVQAQLRPHLEQYLKHELLHADTASGQTGLSAVYDALGDVAAAEKALMKSLELNPQWIPSRILLADLFRRTGRDHLAGDHLRKAREIVPESDDVASSLALWHVRQGQTEEAVMLLEEVWLRAPYVADYAYLYMVALNSTGKAGAALEVADQYLSRHSERRIVELAYMIARDAGEVEKMNEYGSSL